MENLDRYQIPLAIRDPSFAGLAAWVHELRPWSYRIELARYWLTEEFGSPPNYIMRCRVDISDYNYYTTFDPDRNSLYQWVTGIQPGGKR